MEWWTTSLSKFLHRSKYFILQVMVRIWLSLHPELENGNGKQEKEIRCGAEIQYLFNTCIFTKMMAKLKLTSWLTESLAGVCYGMFKTHLHTPLIYGYIPVNEREGVVRYAIRNWKCSIQVSGVTNWEREERVYCARLSYFLMWWV